MVLTRAQKKQQDNNMSNEAAKTLVKISNTPVYIRQRRNKYVVENELKEAREELRKLKLLKQYKSVLDSLKKTMLDTIKMLDEVNHEINQIISELNLSF
jgi:hypothetical protein